MERTLSTLASELLHRLPTMSVEERQLGLEIYRQLARGEPASTTSLAEARKQSSSEITELLERPNLKSLTYLDNGRNIIGFGGLAVRPMVHRLTLNGRTLYTWCAWDSLFIPIILNQDADIESPEPGNGARVRLTVAPDGVKRSDPRSAVMSFLLPTAETFQADALKAMASFCHYIFFFPDRERATAWTSQHPDTIVVSLSDAFELGRQMVAARWRC